MNDAIREAERHGAIVSRTNGGHVRVAFPRSTVFVPYSPSRSNRSIENNIALLRRAIRKEQCTS